jgi:hypothetical protein
MTECSSRLGSHGITLCIIQSYIKCRWYVMTYVWPRNNRHCVLRSLDLGKFDLAGDRDRISINTNTHVLFERWHVMRDKSFLEGSLLSHFPDVARGCLQQTCTVDRSAGCASAHAREADDKSVLRIGIYRLRGSGDRRSLEIFLLMIKRRLTGDEISSN